MSILEQIKNNSITELNLSQDADEITERTSEIVDALRNNKSIVSVDSKTSSLETCAMIRVSKW